MGMGNGHGWVAVVAGFVSYHRPWPLWRRLWHRRIGCCRIACGGATGSESGIGGDSMVLSRVLWVDGRCERGRVEHMLLWRTPAASAVTRGIGGCWLGSRGGSAAVTEPGQWTAVSAEVAFGATQPVAAAVADAVEAAVAAGVAGPNWRLGWCVGMRREFARGAVALEQEWGRWRSEGGSGKAGLRDRRQGREHGS
jgi:hypothetical protein